MSGRVVVGVDGSESSTRALAFAVEEARARGAEVEAVMAFHWLPQDPGMGAAAVHPPSQDVVEEETLAVLRHAVRGITDVLVHPVVAAGSPAKVLLARAAAADLLVVGARGHGGFVGLSLGSTSQQVVGHAPCPVAVVP